VLNVPAPTLTSHSTDIEGSTRLWERNPAAMQAALARHDRVIREAIERHRGRIFKTACHASAAGRRGVTGPGRIARAHGRAFRRRRGAKRRLLRPGGQTLLSGVSGELARDRLPEGPSLRDLGEHRLRDLAHPERLYELAHPDLPPITAPPRTLSVALNNLPL